MKDNDLLVQEAITLAKIWQSKANKLVNNFDKKFHIKMDKMLSNPKDKVLLIELMDQSFRSSDSKRVANQTKYLFEKYGIALFFTSPQRFLIHVFLNIGVYLPSISIPLFIKTIREDTKTVIIKGEENHLISHLQKRKTQGVKSNLNFIGEVVLGEKEANERINKYLLILENPYINYISIKVSTIFSQINLLSYEDTINVVVEKLSKVYDHAQKFSFINEDGEKESKFINLDMEEYRDLALTVDAFKQALDNPKFKNLKAGIVLQAYLSDSHLYQKKLIQWAKNRVENGGSPIKIRLVKGANMEMEKTQAELKHWEIPTYTKKIDTDSNYKIMAEYALDIDNAPYVNLGMASHNVFELAYGYVLAKNNSTLKYFSMEMLEGVSESLRLAIKQTSQDVILYTPTATKSQFTNAIAYLIRRLDENTGKENFIRYSFGLRVGNDDWNMLEKAFVASFENKKNVFIGVKRQQNRLEENWQDFKGGSFETKVFTPEPDTDFILNKNQEWAKNIHKQWIKQVNQDLAVAAVVVGEQDIRDRNIKTVIDKSQLDRKILCGKYALSNAVDLQKAVDVANQDIDNWRGLTHKQRHKILSNVANKVREKRGTLIGVAAAEVGKVFTQTDVEVSEAVDFLEFYGHSIQYFEQFENLNFKGKGVGVVVSPWNFPIAIPLGGIASALAAGNTVILKPASSAVLCAYELCKCFWEAGVSKNTLQFVPCAGSLAGQHLVNNPKVDFIILTGSEETAYRMLKTRPTLFLTAETGGKNATIVTSMADKDQAIQNVITAAFDNSGQKCSATSLLILEDEVFNNIEFKNALKDAAKSLNTGSVWELQNKIGTLANNIDTTLDKALNNLEKNEEWLLKPRYTNNNQYMLQPCIKWGVEDGNFCHMTELFGPVLSVMRAKNLEHAIDLVNKTGYGLTSGIESLDIREVEFWRKNIKAGNLYINKSTTGAIVLRQPFGGIGKSSVGAGRKVGVFNYITQFMDFTENKTSPVTEKYYQHKLVDEINNLSSIYPKFKDDFENLKTALQSYLKQYELEFSTEHDYFKLRGEDNIFKYIPLQKVALRIRKNDTLFDVLSRILAAKVSNVGLHISIENNLQNDITQFLNENENKLLSDGDTLNFENESTFVKCFNAVDRIIFSNISNISEYIFTNANENNVFITRQPPLKEGRLELLNYFTEQSISHSYHRYGNIGIRGVDH